MMHEYMGVATLGTNTLRLWYVHDDSSLSVLLGVKRILSLTY